MVSDEYAEAITEVLDILENSDKNITKKIPNDLIEFWKTNKSKTYKPNLDHNKKINEMKLKEKTKSLIGMIYLNYLCNNEEKAKVKLILKNNEERYQKELREKYNPDNIFSGNQKEKTRYEKETITNETAMIECKESIFKNIIGKILKFFNRRQ